VPGLLEQQGGFPSPCTPSRPSGGKELDAVPVFCPVGRAAWGLFLPPLHPPFRPFRGMVQDAEPVMGRALLGFACGQVYLT